MKKSLAITSALIFTLGVAGTAFAAANPFVDVPAKHWSYDAVTKLAQDGVVTGYDNKTFQGDKEITRYEMAVIVAKAMGKAEKANAEDKALIQKLSAEYSKELNTLGVRMDNLEKKVDKLSISGTARVRYDHQKTTVAGVTQDPAIDSHMNLDVFYGYKINNDWSVQGESEWKRNFAGNNYNGFTGPSTDASSVNAQFEQLYVTGPVAGATVKLGKYSYFSNYGLLYDDKITGARVAFGNKVQVGLNYGNSDRNYTEPVQILPGTWVDASRQNNNVMAIDAKWAVNEKLNIVADWEKVKNDKLGTAYGTAPVGAPNAIKYYDFGFDTKLGQNFTLQAMYAKADADTDNNKAHFVQLTYKAADSTKVGSFDIFAAYRKIPGEAFSPVYPTGDWVLNFKGYRLGFDFVPMENSKFTTWYQDGKYVDTVGGQTKDAKVKTYRAQVEFYF
ncbi:MAG: S-layer homology domain-containing protein [Pelosinus sp.]|nr:S-layer homology domain-containing protein [Pelosinus sp.]